MNGPQFGPRGASYIRKNERTGQLGKWQTNKMNQGSHCPSESRTTRLQT